MKRCSTSIGMESESCSIVSDSLQPHGLYSPWNSLGQNTGVGSLSLLQRDPPNPGIEPRSPTLQADSLPGEPQGSPLMSLGIKERQIKTRMGYYYTHLQMAKIFKNNNNNDNTKCWQGCGKLDHSYIADENVKQYNQLWQFSIKLQ